MSLDCLRAANMFAFVAAFVVAASIELAYSAPTGDVESAVRAEITSSTVREGALVALRCQLKYPLSRFPKLTITSVKWFKGNPGRGIPLVNSKWGITVEKNNLYWPKLNLSDYRQFGKYQCFVYFNLTENGDQVQSATFDLSNNATADPSTRPPRIYSLSHSPNTLYEGQRSVRVVCNTNPGARLSWKFRPTNGQEFIDLQREKKRAPFASRIDYIDGISGLLRLGDLQANESGILQCCAEDRRKQVCRDLSLNVSARPSPLAQLKITELLDATWGRPQFEGASHVIGYSFSVQCTYMYQERRSTGEIFTEEKNCPTQSNFTTSTSINLKKYFKYLKPRINVSSLRSVTVQACAENSNGTGLCSNSTLLLEGPSSRWLFVKVLDSTSAQINWWMPRNLTSDSRHTTASLRLTLTPRQQIGGRSAGKVEKVIRYRESGAVVVQDLQPNQIYLARIVLFVNGKKHFMRQAHSRFFQLSNRVSGEQLITLSVLASLPSSGQPNIRAFVTTLQKTVLSSAKDCHCSVSERFENSSFGLHYVHVPTRCHDYNCSLIKTSYPVFLPAGETGDDLQKCMRRELKQFFRKDSLTPIVTLTTFDGMNGLTYVFNASRD